MLILFRKKVQSKDHRYRTPGVEVDPKVEYLYFTRVMEPGESFTTGDNVEVMGVIK